MIVSTLSQTVVCNSCGATRSRCYSSPDGITEGYRYWTPKGWACLGWQEHFCPGCRRRGWAKERAEEAGQ